MKTKNIRLNFRLKKKSNKDTTTTKNNNYINMKNLFLINIFIDGDKLNICDDD